MKTPFGHLTYCSNIHPGEDWAQHFAILQQSIPEIKKAVSPDVQMGIGLRLANQASFDLAENNNLVALQNWLSENNCYVFTMNGFPYGGFHNTVVKDQVHAPDWTTDERSDYTIRMFNILAKLLPNDMLEGGISTSPLSYRFWWKGGNTTHEAIVKSTINIIKVLEALIEIKEKTGKILHLDIEPEPDGLLENSTEFMAWYKNYLLPIATQHLAGKGIEEVLAIEYIKTHIQLCYDVCHMAVGYENADTVFSNLKNEGINVGKIQISSALKVDFTENRIEKLEVLKQYNEPTYLHQVVAQNNDGSFQKFPDLSQAFEGINDNMTAWRIHFHVPLFLAHYGLLDSTQSDIKDTLAIQKLKAFTNHLEIETYTWGVLPPEFQAPLNESIIREINWVKGLLNM